MAWGKDISTQSTDAQTSTAQKPTAQPKIKLVPVSKIRVPKPQQLDDDLICGKAEAVSIQGQVEPLIVRRRIEKSDGKTIKLTELVAGELILKAVELAGITKVQVIYIDADDEKARLISLGEDIWLKKASVLRRAEAWVEWTDLAVKHHSGQLVRNDRLGRPPTTGISAAAASLPSFGRSVDARRKMLERAAKIAGISPEAKEAAKAAKLDDNESALLDIAKAGSSPTAQLQRVKELAPEEKELAPEEEVTPAADDEELARSPDRSAAASTGTGAEDVVKSADTTSRRADTTIMELEAMWKKHGTKLWAYTIPEVRERFIVLLRRARCKSQTNAYRLVQDVMFGRKRILKTVLYDYAKAKGTKKKYVKQAVQHLGLKSKKYASWPRAPWYFANSDSDWKNQFPKRVADSELGQGQELEVGEQGDRIEAPVEDTPDWLIKI